MSITGNKDHYTIGQVVEKLSAIFSDISISKIRFLEDAGLIKPERTAGGYRKFTENDIKRLTAILKLQKDQYLPLSVIKRNTKLLDSGQASESRKSLEGDFFSKQSKNVSVKEATRKVRLDKKQLDELNNYSIIKMDKTNGKATISELDVEILNIAKYLNKYGIEARHLRMYENFADKESLLVYQIIAPLAKNKRKLEEKASDLSNTLQNLKRILLKRAILKRVDKILPK